MAAPSSKSAHPKWMGSTYDEQLGMLHRFSVTVGEYQLGGWQKVTGLAVEFARQDVPQLGFNTYQVELLKPPTWTPLTLERVVTADKHDWELTYTYLANALANPQRAYAKGGGKGSQRAATGHLLTITINSAWGDPVRALHFANARPCKWEWPQGLSATSTTNVATEKITFVHEGFFPDGSL